MIVIGLDPGIQRAGFAVLQISPQGRVTVQDMNVWNLLPKGQARPSVGERLEDLYDSAAKLFKEWNPRIIGLEKAVSFKNVASAHKLSEARGVLRLAAHLNLDQAEQRLVELSPTAVKRVSSGWGRASKHGVLKSLELRFGGLEKLVLDEGLGHDAIDALAIAFTAWSQTRHRLTKGGPGPWLQP